MQVRVFSLSLFMAVVFCTALFAGSAVWADDAATLREAQAALDKADYDQAVRILKPLVDGGNAEALYVMGRLILEGKGVKKNNTRAAEFFRLAAEKGDVSAMNSWATSLVTGDGVPRNFHEAARWFRKAAEQGHASAQYNLGLRYANGQGVPQDYKEAVAWYRKAAEQGLAAAQNNLGFMYRNGYGVPENTVLAYMLYNLAAAEGDANAIDNRAALSNDMTKAQIEEAQALSREWSVGKPLPTTTKTFKAAKTAKKAEKPAPAKQQQNSPYPARPAAKPGYTTCNTRCFNGDCYRTYSDGEQVHFQAKRKYNGLSGQWEWDSGGC